MTILFLSLLASGLVPLPQWGYIVVGLALTHITIVSVTVYLHRSQAHRGLDLHPAVSHVFRFWLWLTTGMVTKEWAAVHRKHHAKCETPDDPHSPQILGINRVLWRGVFLYVKEARKPETLERYGQNEVLARTITDPDQRAARLRELAEGWARQCDPNSLVTLRKASVKFDAERDLGSLALDVLRVLETRALEAGLARPDRVGEERVRERLHPALLRGV